VAGASCFRIRGATFASRDPGRSGGRVAEKITPGSGFLFGMRVWLTLWYK
jgi:hypothetical protein